MTELALAGASFHRGKSKQDFRTPDNFLRAVQAKFGKIDCDLAADGGNAVCDRCFTVEENSLIQDWHKLHGLLWLNPPFGNIEPWSAKCREESEKGAQILFLVPASVGSNWWAMHVHNHALVYFVRPRLSFDGVNSFPKDIAICSFNGQITGYDTWKWR